MRTFTPAVCPPPRRAWCAPARRRLNSARGRVVSAPPHGVDAPDCRDRFTPGGDPVRQVQKLDVTSVRSCSSRRPGHRATRSCGPDLRQRHRLKKRGRPPGCDRGPGEVVLPGCDPAQESPTAGQHHPQGHPPGPHVGVQRRRLQPCQQRGHRWWRAGKPVTTGNVLAESPGEVVAARRCGCGKHRRFPRCRS